VDSRVQHFPDAQRATLRFGSEEYFRFAEAHPEACPWLAQGGRVAFVLGDTVYEVGE
jgi:hypothetical protein